jgi:transcription elongation factor Elf1
MIVRLPKSLRKNLCCSLCGKTHSTNETVTITNNTSTTTSTNNSTTTSTTIN